MAKLQTLVGFETAIRHEVTDIYPFKNAWFVKWNYDRIAEICEEYGKSDKEADAVVDKIIRERKIEAKGLLKQNREKD